MKLRSIKSKNNPNIPLIIDNQEIVIGQQNILRINAGKLPSDNRINVFAHIYSTGNEGPTVLLMGGVHGDEINGIEIVRRSIEQAHFDALHAGNLIVIPLLNVYGFINFSRDVADGKDVNRSFPGHLNGSLASRVARIITKKILPFVDIAVDFHTGGSARYNFPQTRYHHADIIAEDMATAFGAPVMLEQAYLPHSFRKAAFDAGVPTIIYESGESVRLDKKSIDVGVNGIKRLLNYLEMAAYKNVKTYDPIWKIQKSAWVRASAAGLFIWSVCSGKIVQKGEKLGEIKDPYGTKSQDVISSYSGIIIGHNNASVVNLGDALFHIGYKYSTISKSDQISSIGF